MVPIGYNQTRTKSIRSLMIQILEQRYGSDFCFESGVVPHVFI